MSRASRWLAVGAALVYPTLLTWLYFIHPADRSPEGRQFVFVLGKAIQFGFPAVWMLLVARTRIGWRWAASADWIWGLGSGLLIAGGMLAAYYGGLRAIPPFARAAEVFHAKLSELGMMGPRAMIAIGLFYVLCHSLLEEYYWRWFVYGQLRRLTPTGAAVAISSVGFMAHHVILLATYFSWPWAVVCSLGVAIGGALWAWMYECSGSLWGPWLNHLLADAGIFVIGYQMLFGGPSG